MTTSFAFLPAATLVMRRFNQPLLPTETVNLSFALLPSPRATNCSASATAFWPRAVDWLAFDWLSKPSAVLLMPDATLCAPTATALPAAIPATILSF